MFCHACSHRPAAAVVFDKATAAAWRALERPAVCTTYLLHPDRVKHVMQELDALGHLARLHFTCRVLSEGVLDLQLQLHQRCQCSVKQALVCGTVEVLRCGHQLCCCCEALNNLLQHLLLAFQGLLQALHMDAQRTFLTLLYPCSRMIRRLWWRQIISFA